MKTTLRQIAAGCVLAVAPALIALGAASAAHAEPSNINHGSAVHSPTHHEAFPHQANQPQPGSREHHRHQHDHR
ncbi:MAG TPA: hypothetical protein VL179_16270 [Mycobacterium sp.]|nr:hypothetical protein [Mycobacterium sp.]